MSPTNECSLDRPQRKNQHSRTTQPDEKNSDPVGRTKREPVTDGLQQHKYSLKTIFLIGSLNEQSIDTDSIREKKPVIDTS